MLNCKTAIISGIFKQWHTLSENSKVMRGKKNSVLAKMLSFKHFSCDVSGVIPLPALWQHLQPDAHSASQSTPKHWTCERSNKVFTTCVGSLVTPLFFFFLKQITFIIKNLRQVCMQNVHLYSLLIDHNMSDNRTSMNVHAFSFHNLQLF